MRVKISNKLFSITGKSKVRDEEGKDLFKVKGRFLSPTKLKKICDLEGNTLFVVRNKWFNWLHHTTYIFNADGEQIGYITKNKYSISNSIKAEDFEDDLKITGKFFHRTLNILKNGNQIGTITVDWSFFTDKFTLEVNENENLAFYVALVIAVDNLIDKRQKDK